MPWLDALLEAEARLAAEDERRGPAFERVFWRVISLASSSEKGVLVAAKDGVGASRVGDTCAGSPVPGPEGPEKDGFLRIPKIWLVSGYSGCSVQLSTAC